MIKAVIFDFDGTLSNRMKNAYEVFRDYFRPFFKDMNEMEYEAVLQDMMYFDCNGIIDVDVRLIPFFRKYGSYLPSDFEEKFVPFYYENMYTYTMLREETIEVLENLKKKYKLAILSNGDSSSQHNKIKKVNIEGYFDEVIVSGDLGIHKPDHGEKTGREKRGMSDDRRCLRHRHPWRLQGKYDAGLGSIRSLTSG